ncbi:hypothetical protein C8F04DRAFT_618991 [Mycena alexandri]|uniref:Uncharacterized protein n=1 Tax=Mycena alexandri TaxID=1745969 RepID=A0AAD6X3H9_9AGAR|nr:hypothetical protein C8F04DRAFT_618991 [Mycena alexandri]
MPTILPRLQMVMAATLVLSSRRRGWVLLARSKTRLISVKTGIARQLRQSRHFPLAQSTQLPIPLRRLRLTIITYGRMLNHSCRRSGVSIRRDVD